MIRRWVTMPLVLAATVLQPTSSAAQLRVKAVGGVLGLNSAKISSDDASGPEERRTGPVGGVFLEVGGPGRVSIRPELLLTEKGGKQSDQGSTVTAKLRYLQVPLLLRANIGGSGAAQPYVIFGPSVAFRTGCSVSVHAGSTSLSADCDALGSIDPSLEDPAKKSDVTGIVGAGVDAGVWSIGVRYDHGLSSIASSSTDTNAYTRTLTLLVGIRRALRR